MTDAEAQARGWSDALEALEDELEKLCPCGCGSARLYALRGSMGYDSKSDPREHPAAKALYEKLLREEIEKVRAKLAALVQQEREAVVRYLALHAEETAAWASQQRMLPAPLVQPVAHMLGFVGRAIEAGEHVSAAGETLPQVPPLREG